MKLFVRVFGFVQWLAAVAIAALFVGVQVYMLEQIEGGGVAEALVEMGGCIDAIGGPAVAEMLGALVGGVRLALDSMSVTMPALLLSILLMLSALYCQRAGGSGGRGRHAADAPPAGEATAHLVKEPEAGNAKARDAQA